LVVWEDDRESTPGYQLYQIYGARVTADGLVTDPNGFKITTNRVTRLGPAVVSNGHGFFVAWEDWQRTDRAIADIDGSPVSSCGSITDALPPVMATIKFTARWFTATASWSVRTEFPSPRTRSIKSGSGLPRTEMTFSWSGRHRMTRTKNSPTFTERNSAETE